MFMSDGFDSLYNQTVSKMTGCSYCSEGWI